jgi:RNA polymerase-binding transcription factor DksA
MEDYKTKNFLNDDKNNKIEETVRNTHCCEYTTITSANGKYNICRECGNIILLF